MTRYLFIILSLALGFTTDPNKPGELKHTIKLMPTEQDKSNFYNIGEMYFFGKNVTKNYEL